MVNLLDTYDISTAPLYDVYRITVKFQDRVIGGQALNALTVSGDEQAKKPKKSLAEIKTKYNDELTKEQIAESLEAIAGQEKDEKSWIGFPRDKKTQHMFIWTRCVKAGYKESNAVFKILRDRAKTEHLRHGMEIKPCKSDRGNRLYFYRLNEDGSKKFITEPDGTEERAIQVMTMQGPRTAIKKTDYLEEAYLSWDLWVAPTHAAETRHLKEFELINIMRFMQENGLWADRSIGEGKFDLISIEKVRDGEKASVFVDKKAEAAAKKAATEKKRAEKKAK